MGRLQDLYQRFLHRSHEMETLLRSQGKWKIRNPLDYARIPAQNYLEKLLSHPDKKALFLGMNPGPWGMGQNGIPFGDPLMVRQWLSISGDVIPPQDNIQRIPVVGISSSRREISGKRLWGLFSRLYPDQSVFWKYFGVWNIIPLLILDEKERNITPDRLPKNLRQSLENLSLETLKDLLAEIQVKTLVGVGKYASALAKLLAQAHRDMRVLEITHPSPANPAANRGWDSLVLQTLGRDFFPQAQFDPQQETDNRTHKE